MVCIYCGSKTQVVNSRGQVTFKTGMASPKMLKVAIIYLLQLRRINFSGSLLLENKSGKIEPIYKRKIVI